MKRTRYALVALVLVASFSLGCGGGHDTQATAPEPLPAALVAVKVVSIEEKPGTFETEGSVKFTRESMIASKVMGVVKEVRVKPGERVKKGDILLRIDPADVQGRVDQAGGALAQTQAAYAIAKTNLERFQSLSASGSASQAELDKARYEHDTAAGAVAQARGALQTARSYLNESRVAAPFAGVVVDTLIEEGEQAKPGFPLVKIKGEGGLEFTTTVGQQDVGLLAVGDPVTLLLDVAHGKSAEVAGSISEIVSVSDTGTHTNTVRISFETDVEVRSGTFGRARFQGGAPVRIMTVDADRVVRRGQLSALYLVDPTGTVRLRLIREGKASGGEVEVLSGLQEGDRLIVSDTRDLIDGQPAKIEGPGGSS